MSDEFPLKHLVTDAVDEKRWLRVAPEDQRSLRGLLSARPAAAVDNEYHTYWAMDTDQVFWSDGSEWSEL